jgi:hypothetical protein
MRIEVGMIAKCRRGKIGVVTKRIYNPTNGTFTYKGISDTGGDWQSVEPTFIAENMREWVGQNRSEAGMNALGY